MNWTREFWIFQLLNGAALGGLLFLVASGFTLIMGLMRVINLAHGTFFLFGAYLAIETGMRVHNFWASVVVAGVTVAVAGMLLHRIFLYRFHNQELPQVLMTIGFSLILADLAILVWSGTPQLVTPPDYLLDSVQIGGVYFPLYRLFLIGVGVVVGILLWLFESRTRVGAIVRAGVDDEEMVRGLGININLVFLGVFGLGSLLAGTAGAVGGPFLGAYPGLDHEVLLYALVVVIIGGVGTLRGAALGALLVGVTWNVSNALVPDFAYFTLFGPLALFIAFRPQGLFGRTG
jgi:branched-chain amino acid transport system permease protein